METTSLTTPSRISSKDGSGSGIGSARTWSTTLETTSLTTPSRISSKGTGAGIGSSPTSPAAAIIALSSEGAQIAVVYSGMLYAMVSSAPSAAGTAQQASIPSSGTSASTKERSSSDTSILGTARRIRSRTSFVRSIHGISSWM